MRTDTADAFSQLNRKEVNGEYRHYTWNDSDCVYWADDVDDRFYCDVPQNAFLTLK